MSRFVFEIVVCLFVVDSFCFLPMHFTKKCPNLWVTYKVLTKYAKFSKSRRPSKWRRALLSTAPVRADGPQTLGERCAGRPQPRGLPLCRAWGGSNPFEHAVGYRRQGLAGLRRLCLCIPLPRCNVLQIALFPCTAPPCVTRAQTRGGPAGSASCPGAA